MILITSVVYAVSVNYLYRDRVRIRERVSGRVTDRVRVMVRVMVRVRRPDSSGNLLIWRKIHAPILYCTVFSCFFSF